MSVIHIQCIEVLEDRRDIINWQKICSVQSSIKKNLYVEYMYIDLFALQKAFDQLRTEVPTIAESGQSSGKDPSTSSILKKSRYLSNKHDKV